IRILSPELAGDEGRIDRLDEETRKLAALNHPHMCLFHEAGHEGDLRFLVTEYVDGQSLEARLKDGALPLHEALSVAIAVADALNAAHGLGVKHRDLKPSNVMLSAAGVKVLDFGLAKARSEKVGTARTQGAVVEPETLEYKAPEQLDGSETDARTDIFALGVV